MVWTYLGLSNVGNIIEYNGRIFAIAQQEVYFSDDGGINWTKVYADGYEAGWSFQGMCLEVVNDKMFLATARGLYYMDLIEYDSPRLVVYNDDKIDLGNMSVGGTKDTSIYIQNRGYKD